MQPHTITMQETAMALFENARAIETLSEEPDSPLVHLLRFRTSPPILCIQDTLTGKTLLISADVFLDGSQEPCRSSA